MWIKIYLRQTSHINDVYSTIDVIMTLYDDLRNIFISSNQFYKKTSKQTRSFFFDISLIPSFRHIVPKLEYSPPSFSRRNTPFSIGKCKEIFDVLTNGGTVRPRKKKSKKMLTYD